VRRALIALPNAYLLALLAAAWLQTRRSPPPCTPGRMRFAVLVPARDEEAVIGDCLASLRALDHPADRFETIVIADRCSDGTAAVAARAGATVWERRSGEDGKGAALAWALERLARERPEVDAVAMVDADCTVSPNLLAAFEAHLLAGARAVQAAYGIANPDASWVAALRYASLELMNVVRPLGASAFGGSAGLYGTGMAFRAELLARRPWTARSLVEDREQHLSLVAAGERVAFAREASVRSPAPTTLGASRGQQRRWESGRVALILRWLPTLLGRGLRRRDAAQLHAAVDLVIPPQSILLAAAVAAAARRPTRPAALANLAAQAAFVTGGLALVRAPAVVWRALAASPALAAFKLTLLAQRRPQSWD
jgi:cellulose synthase/poly-beta-1,6-N-acetylglucosamine synthase-like glycosyltransferase